MRLMQRIAQPLLARIARLPFLAVIFAGTILLAVSVVPTLVGTAAAADGPAIIPLDQIKPGMTGQAYTIFAGDQIEKFDLDVIGILPNLLGPKQSVILVQLRGDKVEHTGVVAGMSGSPVYINGKLAGALSLKFGIFNNEPLAGVTPIEDMLGLPTGDEPAGSKAGTSGPSRAANTSDAAPLTETASLERPLTGIAPRYPLPAQWQQTAGVPQGAYLEPIASPLVFSGFAPATIRQYASEFGSYGMVAAAGGTAAPEPDDAKIVPGDMVGMVLVGGDLSMNAACTVTAIVEDRVYACGHPLFGLGASHMPLARGRTLTTLASTYESTKIVNMGGEIGTLTQDRLTAVMGRLGATPPMIPVNLSVVTPAGERQYRIRMISDPKLTPILVGIVAFNGLTQNTTYGEGTTLRLSGSINIAGHSSVALESMYAPTDVFIPDGTAVATTVQQLFSRIFSNPYETPKIDSVSLRVESLPERRIAAIENAWSELSEAEPGQNLTVKVMLRPYRGDPMIRDVPITIPAQAAHGSIVRVQVSDSESLNRIPNQFAAQGRLGSLEQLIGLLNKERHNNQIYVTLFKPTPTILIQDKELPDAPLSEINILDQRRLPGNSALLRESAAGQWSLSMDEVIAGSASVFIKVK
jgi:SpoIVB peptidase S55